VRNGNTGPAGQQGRRTYHARLARIITSGVCWAILALVLAVYVVITEKDYSAARLLGLSPHG